MNNDKGFFRPDTTALIRGMKHKRSNISAIHFDGDVLAELLQVFVENRENGRPDPINSPGGLWQ